MSFVLFYQNRPFGGDFMRNAFFSRKSCHFIVLKLYYKVAKLVCQYFFVKNHLGISLQGGHLSAGNSQKQKRIP